MANQNEYEGQFVNDKFSGQGTLWKQNGSITKGEWKNNMANGFCVCSDKFGYRYEGQMLNNQLNGDGKETYADGSSFKGSFILGKKDGRGLSKSAPGTKVIIERWGIWKNGIFIKDSY